MEPQDTSQANSISIEAEDFSGLASSPFRVQDVAAASNGQVIRLPLGDEGGGNGLTGSVTASLSDPALGLSAGTYTIRVDHFDENDGNAPLSLSINGIEVDRWVLDENPGGAGAGAAERTSHEIEGAVLPAGAELTLTATQDGGGSFEVVRIDRILLSREDHSPSAEDDSVTVDEASPVSIAVLANDSDPDGDPVRLESVDFDSTAGSVTVGDGQVLYDPVGAFDGLRPGESATDTFRYSITDGDGGSDTAKATVTVTGLNDEPVPETNAGITVIKSSGAPILPSDLTVSDADNDPEELTYAVIAAPDQGRLELMSAPGAVATAFTQADIDAGRVVYVHGGGDVATDSFDFVVTDGSGGETIAQTFAVAVALPPGHLIYAGFDAGGGEFIYVDDAFRGTDQPDYADGAWVDDQGIDGPGSLRVTLGGIDGSDITSPGMSGGWQTSFDLAQPGSLSLTFSYDLSVSGAFDAIPIQELTEILVSVDGQLYGLDGPDYVDMVPGEATRQSADPRTVVSGTATLDLGEQKAGAHTVIIGARTNQKTTATEDAVLRIDDVSVTTPVVNSTPTALGASLTVSDNSADGTPVMLVFAFDPNVDQALTYEIAGGNETGAFAIDAVSGLISVADATLLDAGVPGLDAYALTITVTDDGETPLSDTADIDISVVRGSGSTAVVDTGSVRPVDYQFTKAAVAPGESRIGVTSVAVGPDGNVYASDVTGLIQRYVIDPQTGLATSVETIYQDDTAQIIGLTVDPDSTADDVDLWISYAERDSGNFSGTIARLSLPDGGAPGLAAKTDIITGLPHTEPLNHMPNGIDFDSDGKLYMAIGSITSLGQHADLDRVPGGDGAQRRGPRRRRKERSRLRRGAGRRLRRLRPVRLFCAGHPVCHRIAEYLRPRLAFQRLSLRRHQPELRGEPQRTPADPANGIPDLNARPNEMFVRVDEGQYYGHPNPARGEFVLNGGNPTDSRDPWEVDAYPVGIRPDPDFDPSLIFDIRSQRGDSPTG